MLFPFNTNMGFSAVRPAATSSNSCRVSKCRLSQLFIQYSQNRRHNQRHVMVASYDASAKIVVMSEKGHEFLRSVHDVPARKIEVIPHGIPDFPFLEAHHAKAKFDLAGKMIILTFGLLSPNKGIETMLDAMPKIIKSCPNALYVVLGATHPHLVRQQGEAYRDSLMARAKVSGSKITSSFSTSSWIRQRCWISYQCATSMRLPISTKPR